MPSPLMKKGDELRPEFLQKNLYKVDSPYDLTDDVVSKSLNLLQSITGYDYRSNTVIDIVERLIDSKNSDLVKIGGERLLVEFGRRAAINTLGKFIPSPTNLVADLKNIFKGDFKKGDDSITDLSKDPSKTFFDQVLQTGIGYRSNDNFLDKEYGKHVGGDSDLKSDVNYKFSGDMIKEKILQLNKNSVFSSYNIKTTTKINWKTQSLVFKNTYSQDFINQNPDIARALYDKDILTDTYTKTYFKGNKLTTTEVDFFNLSSNELAATLAKDVFAEIRQIEESEGFGKLSNIKTREKNTDPIQIQKVQSAEVNRLREVGGEGENSEGTADTFRYDSNTSGQNLLNKQFGVRRGLVYFTSKLSKEGKSTINHDVKQLLNKDKGKPNSVYWKGNGECRTFTVYDQYDNYSRVIKFDGNNEKNSVLKESVLPRIAPMIGDRVDEKHRYFFTMENLAVKPEKLKTGDSEDCDYGPNGGKWMWFVPYNVKLSDNNSVSWSDLNFLGRPEPVFSYQNTKRGLSLSFTLLIDTVKEMQDVESTIQNYRDYIYGCAKAPEPKKEGTTPEPIPVPPPKKTIKSSPIEGPKVTYFFKNDRFTVRTDEIDYTSLDDCKENKEGDDSYDLPNLTLSTLTYNNNFFNNFTAATKFLDDNIATSEKIVIDIKGFASFLFTKKDLKSPRDRYNNDLGFRRGYDMFKKFVDYFNANSSNKIIYTDEGFIQKKAFGVTITKKQKISNCEVIFNITSKGDNGSSGNSTFPNRNDGDQIKDRKVEITSIRAYPAVEKPEKKTTEDEKEKTARNDMGNEKGLPCDPILSLEFEKLNKLNKVPVGYEKLKTFTPSFNSQTPFDFTKRYVFLHQLTRPGKLDKNITTVDNIVFGRMPVFILRYGDFIHTKAIANSINFDIQDSTWDLNPEGMGVIPLICNVTMDLTLIGGQSLAGPIDRIQTANDSSFIANTSFNSGRYNKNTRFKSSRGQEFLQYGDRASGEQETEKVPVDTINTPGETEPPVTVTLSGSRPTQQPFIGPIDNGLRLPTPTRNQIIEERAIVPGQRNFIGPISNDEKKVIDKDAEAKAAQKQKEDEAEEARINSMQSPVRINPFIGF